MHYLVPQIKCQHYDGNGAPTSKRKNIDTSGCDRREVEVLYADGVWYQFLMAHADGQETRALAVRMPPGQWLWRCGLCTFLIWMTTSAIPQWTWTHSLAVYCRLPYMHSSGCEWNYARALAVSRDHEVCLSPGQWVVYSCSDPDHEYRRNSSVNTFISCLPSLCSVLAMIGIPFMVSVGE